MAYSEVTTACGHIIIHEWDSRRYVQLNCVASKCRHCRLATYTVCGRLLKRFSPRCLHDAVTEDERVTQSEVESTQVAAYICTVSDNQARSQTLPRTPSALQ